MFECINPLLPLAILFGLILWNLSYCPFFSFVFLWTMVIMREKGCWKGLPHVTLKMDGRDSFIKTTGKKKLNALFLF
jgi:hypothetical protein